MSQAESRLVPNPNSHGRLEPLLPVRQADGAQIAHRVLTLAARLIVTLGAVIAAGQIMRTSGPLFASIWLWLSISGAYVAVALWFAWSDTLRLGAVAWGGAWLSMFVLFNGLVATSPQVYYKLLVLLAALCLASLHVREAEHRALAEQDH